MSLPKVNSELREVIDRLCNDDLSDGNFERLVELLSHDVAAQRYYIEYLDMNESMRDIAVMLEHEETIVDLREKLARLRALGKPSLLADANHSHDGGPGARESEVEAQFVEVSRIGDATPHRNLRGVRPRWPQSLHGRLITFLSGSVLAGAVVFQLARLGYFGPAQPGSPKMASSTMPAVAYMTSTTGCDWNGAAPWLRAVGNSVQVGDEIALNEGIAEFRLADGVYISVEGPAGLVLTSPGSLVLQYGKITVRVPWANRKYRILAGACRLETSDAEFGVWVTGGRTDIHVFSGDVLASNALMSNLNRSELDVDPAPLAASRKQFTLGIVSQGHAIAVDNRRSVMQVTHSGVADPSLFATKLSMAGPLPVSKSYVDRIRADHPIDYWRFESETDDAVRNEIPGGCELSVVGDVRLTRLAGNRVAEIPPGVDSYMFSRAPLNELANSDYSFEVWVKPSHVHYGTILGLCPSNPITAFGNAFLLEVQSSSPPPGRPDFGHPNSIRFLHRDPPVRSSLLGTNCFSNDPYTVRRWQHVVAVKRGSQMELYVDGNLEAEATDQSSLSSGQRLVIGRQALSVDKSFQFIGQLDEVAVYAKALTPQEIRAHYKMIDWTQAKKLSIYRDKS